MKKKKNNSTATMKLDKSKQTVKQAKRHFQKKKVKPKSSSLANLSSSAGEPKATRSIVLPFYRRRAFLVSCVVVFLLACGPLAYWYKEHVSSQKAEKKRVEKYPPLAINSRKPPGPAPDGMVWVPGGWFWMGDDHGPYNDTRPVHKVYVDGYWMDKTEVTKAQFAKFAKATGYKTVAERKPRIKDFQKEIDAARDEKERQFLIEKLKHPFSIVFKKPLPGQYDLHNHLGWWEAKKGASWRNPDPDKALVGDPGKYPAVHIAFEDAVAYCKWAKKRLPTEAEWEFAARGGLNRKKYCWGDKLLPDQETKFHLFSAGIIGKGASQSGLSAIHAMSEFYRRPKDRWYVNNWQGKFPDYNANADGYYGAAPVASYPPNGYGLHDMAGNVWEWCSDWYQTNYYEKSPQKNPKGPAYAFDPREAGVVKRVQRGGSFLCADNYCIRYLPGARGKGEPTSAQNHCGFRCVMDAKKK